MEAGWSRTGRYAAYVAAPAFFAGSVLYLLDAEDVLGAKAEFHATGAGPLHDEATFWVAHFAHQHQILWDIYARDTLLPLAFVALIVLSLAVANVIGWRRPEVQLMVAFVAIGGTLAALADLTYLAGAEYWRLTGWSTSNAIGMVAVGRASAAVDTLTRWPEAAGFVALAGGLALLARICRTSAQLSARLGALVALEALLLVGIAIAGAAHADDAYDVLSLLTGVVVGPAVTLWLGLQLGRPARPLEVAQTAPI